MQPCASDGSIDSAVMAVARWSARYYPGREEVHPSRGPRERSDGGRRMNCASYRADESGAARALRVAARPSVRAEPPPTAMIRSRRSREARSAGFDSRTSRPSYR